MTELSSVLGFHISLEVDNNRTPANATDDNLTICAGLSTYKYTAPNDFKKFEDSTFNSTHNKEFYEELQKMYPNAEGDTKPSDAKKALNDLMKEIQEMFKGYSILPEDGAWWYKSDVEVKTESFGKESGADWGKDGGAQKTTKDALKGSLLKEIGSVAGSVFDKFLLVTYDSEMFSCYTAKIDPAKKTMSGVPMGLDVNYYFQSELEYLFAGHEKYAPANLATVAGLLFLVRFVFNYIASFTIKDVNTVVKGIKAAFAYTGPIAIVIGELARLAIALAESVLDVGALRSGKKVVLLKDNDTWQFSVDGLLDAAEGEVKDISENLTKSSGDDKKSDDDDDEKGLLYTDYMRIFLLLVDGDKLAERTAFLISLNMTNKGANLGKLDERKEREKAMSKLELFDMEKAYTDFTIITTVDMRMLFLSMPFAQKGVNGIIPPKTVPITITDYRGY